MRCLQIAYVNPSEVHPEALVLERATGHTSVGFLPPTNSMRSPYVSPQHYSILETLRFKIAAVYGTSTTEFCVHFMFPLRYKARPP
jgi:hypothetical protein